MNSLTEIPRRTLEKRIEFGQKFEEGKLELKKQNKLTTYHLKKLRIETHQYVEKPLIKMPAVVAEFHSNI